MLKIKTSTFIGVLLTAMHSTETPAGGTAFDPYAIPHDKSVLEHCRQAALTARPGQVKAFQIHNTTEAFHYQFEIETQDRSHWIVVCEGNSRKIVRNEMQE